MTVLIRAAILGAQTRKLKPGRLQAAPAPAPCPEVTAAACAMAPPPPVDAAAERAAEAARQAEMLAALRQEAEAARRKAEQEGYAAGHAKGIAESHEAHREKLEQLGRLVDAAGRAFAAEFDGIEDVAAGIAFAAVCKILGRTLMTPEGVRAVVGEVVKQAKESEKLLVRLAPSDFYMLLQQQGGPAGQPPPPHIEWVPDERVVMGGCLLEASGGGLDGRIETQLDLLRGVLLQVRTAGSGGEAAS